MSVVFSLSVHQMVGRWRIPVIAALASIVVVLSVLLAVLAGDDRTFDRDFTNSILDGLLVGAILPLVVMVLATAAFGNEMDDRTLSYLVLKPIPRWEIVLPKYGAVLIVGGPFLLASGIAAALVALDRSPQATVAVAAALVTGIATYGAIFTWAGLVTNRALAYALVYVLIWEGLISTFFSGIRYLSVRGYTLSVLYWTDQDRFETLEDRVIEAPAAIGGAIVVTAVFLWLTIRRLNRMDVP